MEELPEGEFLPPWELNAVEKELQRKIEANHPGRRMVAGRSANFNQPNAIHLEQGRGQCQVRNLCSRGCPYGGYFSSNSSTLP